MAGRRFLHDFTLADRRAIEARARAMPDPQPGGDDFPNIGTAPMPSNEDVKDLLAKFQNQGVPHGPMQIDPIELDGSPPPQVFPRFQKGGYPNPDARANPRSPEPTQTASAQPAPPVMRGYPNPDAKSNPLSPLPPVVRGYPNPDARSNPGLPDESPVQSAPPERQVAAAPQAQAMVASQGQAQGQAQPQNGYDALFGDPEKLKALFAPFRAQQGTATLPQPRLPQGPDLGLMQDTLRRANTLGMLHGAFGTHIPSTYEVMKTGSAKTSVPDSPSYDAARSNIMLPLEMEKARVGIGNEQSKVQNAYEQEKAKLGVQLGIHGSSQLSGLLGRYLGVVEGRERQQRQFQHSDEAQQRTFGQAKSMLEDKTVIGQNKPPEEHQIQAGRLASNALMAADKMENMLDEDKSTWDKGLQAKVPGTHYTIGTEASKKFSALQGAMISQLTQSDEVRRTTGNINDALGQTVVNAGDSMETAKWKLSLFRQMMSGIHRTIAANHPLWSLTPGHDEYAKYVTPDMVQESQKAPKRRASEFLNNVKNLTPPEQPFDPEEFLRE